MTDDPGPVLEVFTMYSGAPGRPVSLYLPVSRARPLDAVEVLPFDPGPTAAGPLRVVDPSAPEAEPLMTFPWAADMDEMLAGRRRWAGLPPVPLPDVGWHDLDQGWWVWLIVRDGWVFGAQTDFDAGVAALRVRAALTWTGAGRGLLGGVPLTWFRVPRPSWDAAWERIVGPEPVGRGVTSAGVTR